MHICITVTYKTIHESHWAFYYLCDLLCTFVLLLFIRECMNHTEHFTICVIPCAHLYYCCLQDNTWITMSTLLFVWFLVHICITVVYKTIHELRWALCYLCDSLCTLVLLLLIRPYMNRAEHSNICVISCAPFVLLSFYNTIYQSHWALYRLCDSLCTLFKTPYMKHTEHSTICVIPCAHLYEIKWCIDKMHLSVCPWSF